MTKKTSDSPMKKGNILAVVIVIGLFIYVLNHENTPTPPPDRTVYSKKTTPGDIPRNTWVENSKDRGDASVTDIPSGAGTAPSTSLTESEKPQAPAIWSASSGDNTGEPEKSSVEATTLSGITQSGVTQTGVTTYYNSYLDYGLSIPKWAFYAGYGGQDGAAHTMGFATGTGVSNFETAEIKLWYFPNKILPELKEGENSFYQDPSTNMTYLKLGNGTIRMEWDMENPILLKIVETVYRGD